MSTSLASANPHLRDPDSRRRSVLKSVATSSAIEGIRAPFAKAVAKRKADSKAVTRAKA